MGGRANRDPRGESEDSKDDEIKKNKGYGPEGGERNRGGHGRGCHDCRYGVRFNRHEQDVH